MEFHVCKVEASQSCFIRWIVLRRRAQDSNEDVPHILTLLRYFDSLPHVPKMFLEVVEPGQYDALSLDLELGIVEIRLMEEALAYEAEVRSGARHMSNDIPISPPNIRQSIPPCYTILDFPDTYPLPGTILPQVMYQDQQPFDRLPTFRFYVNGKAGIKLTRALDQDFSGLANDNVTLTDIKTLTCRILVRAYVCSIARYLTVCAHSVLGINRGSTISSLLTAICHRVHWPGWHI